jgi:molybdate transport system ATP-binding protein
LLSVLQLDHLLERSVTTLSGGEQQGRPWARILTNLRLLMDEPLSALDDSLRFQIIPYLKSVSEQFGIPYLFISHSLVEMRLIPHVLALERGVVTGQSSSEQLAKRMGKAGRVYQPAGVVRHERAMGCASSLGWWRNAAHCWQSRYG